MKAYTKSMQNLIDEFTKMPGIGPKTAERLAFYCIRLPRKQVDLFAQAIVKAKQTVGLCKECNNLSEGELCDICQDPKRDKSIICVVEHPKDVISIEKSASYKGLYHVLMGALSPLEGIGPDELKIPDLAERVKNNKIKEVIIATDSDTDGETTVLYLAKVLKPLGARISRIAYGLPVGANLEFADQATLTRALDGRRQL